MRRVDLDDITFDFGSWEVNPSQYGKLDRIARAMRRIIDRNPDEVFMIEGYTDAVGSPDDNLSLSDRRAQSVAEVLSEQFPSAVRKSDDPGAMAKTISRSRRGRRRG